MSEQGKRSGFRDTLAWMAKAGSETVADLATEEVVGSITARKARHEPILDQNQRDPLLILAESSCYLLGNGSRSHICSPDPKPRVTSDSGESQAKSRKTDLTAETCIQSGTTCQLSSGEHSPGLGSLSSR